MADDAARSILAGDSDSNDEFLGFDHVDNPSNVPRTANSTPDTFSDIDVSSVGTSDLSDFDDDSESDTDSSTPSMIASGPSSWMFRDLRSHRIPDFTGTTPGAADVLPRDAKEIDFFNLFVSDSMITVCIINDSSNPFDFDIHFLSQAIVDETNSYAERKKREKADPQWSPVNFDEIKAFLGIRMYMSIVNLPQTDMYWSQDPVFGNLFIRHVMQRNRFDKISQYFHVADISSNPPRGNPLHNKLAHVHPFLEAVRRNCTERYHPHQNVSVDEAMVAFRGRLGFRQYIPSKPCKYGIKVWMRADPHNGYCQDFQVYTGKTGNGKPEGGLGARVVKDLVAGIGGKSHIFNCDNFFSSPALFSDLSKDQIFARGTVRQDRKGLPPPGLFSKKKLKTQGESVVSQKGILSAVKWQDKKTVSLLSAADAPLQMTEVKRKKKDGSSTLVPCPLVVQTYNQFMNGVDYADQLRNEYPTYRRSKKWWHYLFWFLWDISVCNAFILMKESPAHQRKTKGNKEKKLTLLEFKMALAKTFIGNYRASRKRSLTSSIDPTGDCRMPTRGKKARCPECRFQGRGRKEPSNRCQQCNVSLCVECFAPYHKRVLGM